MLEILPRFSPGIVLRVLTVKIQFLQDFFGDRSFSWNLFRSFLREIFSSGSSGIPLGVYPKVPPRNPSYLLCDLLQNFCWPYSFLREFVGVLSEISPLVSIISPVHSKLLPGIHSKISPGIPAFITPEIPSGTRKSSRKYSSRLFWKIFLELK